MKGTISRLMPNQGIGFVKTRFDEEIVFDRYALEGYGFDSFSVGETVTFNIEEGPKGQRAVNIRIAMP